MMKDEGLGFQTVDIPDSVVHEIEENNFPWLELAMRNQDGCSSLGCKNLNLIQTQLEKLMFVCSCGKLENCSQDGQLLEL
jgi:hypothetical protein